MMVLVVRSPPDLPAETSVSKPDPIARRDRVMEFGVSLLPDIDQMSARPACKLADEIGFK
jgi:hypothetical protein